MFQCKDTIASIHTLANNMAFTSVYLLCHNCIILTKNKQQQNKKTLSLMYKISLFPLQQKGEINHHVATTVGKTINLNTNTTNSKCIYI